jgi:alpha-galactosidase
VRDESGGYPVDNEGLHQLCPAHEPALEHVRRTLERVVSTWGFDGVYTDFQGLGAVPPCFAPEHGHRTPLDSYQAVPRLFETIAATLRRLKPGALHEVCVCSFPHSPYNMPFYDLANASDPRTPLQARRRVKAEKAIRGGGYAVGDCYQVPADEWKGSSLPESFESAIGTGAQLTTFYRDLDEGQRATWTRWFREYRELDLARAEYVNLYDLAFDLPEAHVVRKGRDLFYGFFAERWPRTAPIELRGLDPGTTYEAWDYGNRRPLGTVSGADPRLRVGFDTALLVRLRPLAAQAPAAPPK